MSLFSFIIVTITNNTQYMHHNDFNVSFFFLLQKFVILPHDFSIAGGELTPTMKLKRQLVLEKYHEHVLKMYSD